MRGVSCVFLAEPSCVNKFTFFQFIFVCRLQWRRARGPKWCWTVLLEGSRRQMRSTFSSMSAKASRKRQLVSWSSRWKPASDSVCSPSPCCSHRPAENVAYRPILRPGDISKSQGVHPLSFITLLSPLFPLLLSPSFLSLPLPFARSRPPYIPKKVWGALYSSSSEIWGGAPDEIEFDAF